MSVARPRSRFGWLKATFKWLIILLVVTIGAGLAYRAYVLHSANNSYQLRAAELDRSDAGWRWAELLAAREEIPAEQNAAEVVVAAVKLIPENWPNQSAVRRPPPVGMDDEFPPPVGLFTLQWRVEEFDRNERLDAETAGDLSAEMEALKEAIAALRRISHFQKGRFAIEYDNTNPALSSVPQLHLARSATTLLEFNGALQAHNNDIDGAMDSVRCALGVARATGNEPFLIAVLVRMACGLTGVKSLERGLGQGSATDEILRSVAADLEREEADGPRAMHMALRGERAINQHLYEQMLDGKLSFEEFSAERPDGSFKGRVIGWSWTRLIVARNRAPSLDVLTRIIRLSELTRPERQSGISELDRERRRLQADSATEEITAPLVQSISKMLDVQDRYQALLRSARVAIALERYRLHHKDWPEKLDQLVPAFIEKIPVDPFGEETIRYRRVGKDVLVYSVGLDGVDNNGAFDPLHPLTAGSDLVFRLWHPDNRGVPAKPKPPPAEPFGP